MTSLPRLILCGIAFALGILVASWAIEAPAAGFYQWVDEVGVVSSTDDAKRVPARYRDQVVQRTWEELRADIEARWTPHSTSRPAHVWTIPPDEPQKEECAGHITLEREWAQRGDYHFYMFIVVDECGRVVSVTPQQPRIGINR
jgi:hypothetical protein